MVGVGLPRSRIASSRVVEADAVLAFLDNRAEKLTELFKNPIIPVIY
jgi:hypothetical protein